MPVKYIPYYPNTIEGQAILDNFTRTRRVLKYRDNDKVHDRIKRGLPLYEVEKIESVGNNPKNLIIRGECLAACAYLKDKGIEVDLVYIDPPFASGADYAKKVYIRRNLKVAEAIEKAEEQLDIEELRSFEEKMYGDIWNKEDYLNWMFENLVAIKSIMSDRASIYAHLSWHIGHYVKILLDEVFGENNFKNEIIWHYEDKFATGGNSFDKNHDIIFWFTKNEDEYYFEPIIISKDEPSKRALRKKVNGKTTDVLDESGNKIIVEYTDKKIDDVWDIPRTIANGDYLDYSTQKPDILLERIINSGSNEGMLVVDFFGGSGVTAKVANDLKRNFIHVDVGINSIQTTRDRLIASNAEFDILDIKDGVSLFRNPVQTMDKLKSLIIGLKNEDSLPAFWEGAINDSKLGLIPVYIPNLIDHSTKVLDIHLMNRIINEAIPDLPDGTKQVIIYYIDIDDEKNLLKFIDEYGNPEVKIILRDLKEILDEVVINDIIDFEIKEENFLYVIQFVNFISHRLLQKIDEYNQKKGLNGKKPAQTVIDDEIENGDDSNGDDNEQPKPKKFIPIEISDSGLELIEMISLDCTNNTGVWNSDYEIKIDKKGYMIINGSKTKEFWDGKVSYEKKPIRMKVRNIAGDESIIVM